MLNVNIMLQRRRILASPTGLALFGLAGFLMRDTATLMGATELEHALFPNLCCARAHRTPSHLPTPRPDGKPGLRAFAVASMLSPDGIQSDPRLNTKGHGLH